MISTLRVQDIPSVLLKCINEKSNVYLIGKKVKEIFIYRESQYRINTTQGQYRYPIDSDVTIEIY